MGISQLTFRFSPYIYKIKFQDCALIHYVIIHPACRTSYQFSIISRPCMKKRSTKKNCSTILFSERAQKKGLALTYFSAT